MKPVPTSATPSDEARERVAFRAMLILVGTARRAQRRRAAARPFAALSVC
jgi:hypothetical protein